MDKIMVLNKEDNVAVVIKDKICKETVVTLKSGDSIHVLEDIPFGFKIALKYIKKGEIIVKYGVSIGKATIDIDKGVMVHIHNVEGLRGRGDL